MKNHNFYWENPLFLWPFSIAMLYSLPEGTSITWPISLQGCFRFSGGLVGVCDPRGIHKWQLQTPKQQECKRPQSVFYQCQKDLVAKDLRWNGMEDANATPDHQPASLALVRGGVAVFDPRIHPKCWSTTRKAAANSSLALHQCSTSIREKMQRYATAVASRWIKKWWQGDKFPLQLRH